MVILVKIVHYTNARITVLNRVSVTAKVELVSAIKVSLVKIVL